MLSYVYCFLISMQAMIAEICSNLVNDTLVSDRQLQLTLSHMIDWLKWPRHITIHHWIVQIARFVDNHVLDFRGERKWVG